MNVVEFQTLPPSVVSRSVSVSMKIIEGVYKKGLVDDTLNVCWMDAVGNIYTKTIYFNH